MCTWERSGGNPLKRSFGLPGEGDVVDYLYIRWRVVRDGRKRVGEGELLAARALYYIIGGHFGPPKLLSEHKKYEVLLGPPFFRAASGAALPVRTATEKGGARRRESKTPACI